MNQKDKMYNILLCMDACWSSEGGIQRVNLSFLRFFAKHPDIFHFTACILKDFPDMVPEDFRRMDILGCAQHKIDFIRHYIRCILRNHYDLIIFTHARLSVLGLIAKLCGIKYAVFLHGIEIWKTLSIYKTLALAQSSMLIANSEFTKMKGSLWYTCLSQANVCHLGIDLPDPGSKQLHRFTTMLQGKPTILIVGRMARAEQYSKGHKELLEATSILIRKLPDVMLVITGQGRLKENLEQEVEKNHLSANVLFTGYVPDDTLTELYQACQVFAMPSRGEGFGLVYVEAMACGKACIGSTVDAAREVIMDGETGFLVDLDDAYQLADRLYFLLTNQEQRIRMEKAAFERYRRFFTEEKFHERLFKMLMGGL